MSNKTITGRISDPKPNLQNVPIRTREGRRIRGAFLPERSSLIFDQKPEKTSTINEDLVAIFGMGKK